MVSFKAISILTIIICLLQLAAYTFLLVLNEGSALVNNEILWLMFTIVEHSTVRNLIICSVVLNGIWLITSICLTHFASKDISLSLKVIGIIWIVFAILNYIFDVALIGVYVNDIIKESDYFVIESYLIALIILLIISARGIIILIINFWTIIAMLIKITRLSKDLRNEPKKRTVPLKPPKPVLKQSKETHLEEENVPRVQDWYDHYEQPEVKNKPPPEKTDVIPRFIPRIQKVYSDFRGNSPASSNRTPPNNNQTSHTTGIPGSNTNVMVNGVPSGTLRRQLPWSYMANLNKPRAPPVPPPKPHVPAPDYDLRQPQPYMRKDLQQPNWSQYM